jgi:hypothetical protein
METPQGKTVLKNIPETSWEMLSQKRIFFAHQSVGFNILDGIADLKQRYPQIKLNIVKTTDPLQFKQGMLVHTQVGVNMNPVSKISGFSDLIQSGFGEKSEIAFFKFCYIDLTPGADVKTIFATYQKTMEKLSIDFPQVVFVHFTVPLTSRQTGLKAFIKKILGKSLRGEEDNIVRTEFNNLLTEEYQGKEPIFDLARAESTYPDGTLSTFEKDGKTYPCLVPGYTEDGEHLNQTGRQVVAEKLLYSLVGLLD